MKIALLVHDHHRAGGHSRYVAELATRLARDHDVHVYANTFVAEPGIRFHHVPANRSSALALILTFRRNATRLLQLARFDVVHDQGLCTASPNVLTAHISNRSWLRARPGAPVSEKLFSAIAAALEWLQYARAGHTSVIAVSDRIKRDLAQDYNLSGAVTVIPHGVDTERFTPANRSDEMRSALGMPPAEPLFLFVGDLRKGAALSIRALNSGHLLCVSGTPPGPYRELAQGLNRSDRVHFHPATSTIERYYAGADVLLLPTPYDAFGMVVLEGMAAGLPVIVSRQAGASELIRHGDNGFVLQQPADLPALMQEAAHSSVGRAARETALAYSWDRTVQQTLAVYRTAAQAPRLLTIATQGAGGADQARLLTLASGFPTVPFLFDQQHKAASALSLCRTLLRARYPMALMEGTGIAGGLPLLAFRLLTGQRYAVSSGDAVGPFMGQREPLLAPLFGIYERLLCRGAAGFIGWSPYLTGRALTFGARRAMTCAGWAPAHTRSARGPEIRKYLGIPPDALVIGIAGSLAWTRRVRYCYGYELVRAAAFVTRTDVRFLIVGQGNGRAELERFPDPRVILTGFIERAHLPDYLAAMDVASLPQSCNRVGSFRYTTKLSEYLAAGLPVVTGQIPAAYDLDNGWAWRLPGDAPWDERYIRALAHWLDELTPEDLASHRAHVSLLPEFDRDAQIRRATAFLGDLMDR